MLRRLEIIDQGRVAFPCSGSVLSRKAKNDQVFNWQIFDMAIVVHVRFSQLEVVEYTTITTQLYELIFLS